MGKKGKGTPKSNNRNPKTQPRNQHVSDDDMDDEIDTFHKQREMIPLDINQDLGDSDEDDVHPVFDDEDINDDEEEDDDDEDAQLTGLAAKMARQHEYLQAKTGGVEDDMHEDDEDEDEAKIKENWGAKNNYWNGDNADYEIQSSDEEGLIEEEVEAIRLRREKSKHLSMEDFIPNDDSQEDSDEEPTLEEISTKGKRASKASFEKDTEKVSGAAFEVIKKDLNSLSREEQMDMVYSSAPELVGLLSELNDALDQLENKVNPLLSKVKGEVNMVKGGMHYLEVKQALLLSYCQAINFYLLLKSEGHSVRDHPVIARLVEIKSLLDKLKELEEPLAFEFEEILTRNEEDVTELKLVSKNAILTSGAQGITVSNATAELIKVEPLKKVRGEKLMREVDKVGIQSMEMLKVRASLEEKLKQKGILSSNSMKANKAQKKRSQPVNGQLETGDDFDDETGIDGLNNEHSNSLRHTVSQAVTSAKMRMPKIASGDDDLPQRDDIGERRRKHELHVLAGAGVNSDDENDISDDHEDVEMEENNESEEESEEDFYKQVEERRAAKIAAKAEFYSSSRPLAGAPSLPETTVDGKRQISNQMEKNRGLTRHRKKLTKNPRKKYKLAHQKAVVRRKGQVRDIKKPCGPYGGEASGINTKVSKSVRFKN